MKLSFMCMLHAAFCQAVSQGITRDVAYFQSGHSVKWHVNATNAKDMLFYNEIVYIVS
jgi:hypothetical protein